MFGKLKDKEFAKKFKDSFVEEIVKTVDESGIDLVGKDL